MTTRNSISIPVTTTTSTSAQIQSPSQAEAPAAICSRPYVTLAKLLNTFIVLILIVASASIWSTRLHPTFLFTLLTCFMTFITLSYRTFTPSTKSPTPTRLQTTLHLLLLHLLPLVLWLASTVLLSLWTHTYQTTTWRSGTRLDAERVYLAELPPGLTPANIATNHFRRLRTGKYIAAVRIVGVCAGMAGLMVLLCATEGIKAGLEVRAKAVPGPGSSAGGSVNSERIRVSTRIMRWLGGALTRRKDAALPVTERDAEPVAVDRQRQQDRSSVLGPTTNALVPSYSNRWETISHTSHGSTTNCEQNEKNKDLVSPPSGENVGVNRKNDEGSGSGQVAGKKGWFGFLTGNKGDDG